MKTSANCKSPAEILFDYFAFVENCLFKCWMNKTKQGNQGYSYKTKEMCFLFSWQQTTIQFVFNFQAFPLTLFTDPRYTYIMSHPLDHLMHIHVVITPRPDTDAHDLWPTPPMIVQLMSDSASWPISGSVYSLSWIRPLSW